MNTHQKTRKLIEEARKVFLEAGVRMTLRQLYYQLVSRQIIENKLSEYQKLSRAMVLARQEGIIPWEWIEDRIRTPHYVSMWNGLGDFMETVRGAYRRNIWEAQPRYIVVWVEKDALSGIFEDITFKYRVPLIVGRGYSSWSLKRELAEHIEEMGKPTVVLYFGDFDPSGEDIFRDLEEAFDFFGILEQVEVLEKVALTREDIVRYNLPPNPAKRTDPRAQRFISQHGDTAVELDALPVQVLQEKIRENIERYLDMEAFERILEVEEGERGALARFFANQ